MKIEITNDFIKRLEKALKHEVPYASSYCEIHNINIDFVEGVFYTVEVHWGVEEKKIYHSVELCFQDSDSIEFIRGMFSRVIYEYEMEELKNDK